MSDSANNAHSEPAASTARPRITTQPKSAWAVCAIVLLAICGAYVGMRFVALRKTANTTEVQTNANAHVAQNPGFMQPGRIEAKARRGTQAADSSPQGDAPPAVPPAVQPGFLFKSSAPLTVRLDFFKPNDGAVPDEKYFAIGMETQHRFPWNDILLVNPTPAFENGSNHAIQIRARVRGLKALIEKADPGADTFPVRIYRTFVNDLDDDESVYVNAYTKLFGAAPVDGSGQVKEPTGRRMMLKRIKSISGDEAVFISNVIDIATDKDLNPVKSTLPAPPTFAASDGDAYYTQYHETIGDEEPDAWAFGQALKKLGFVSAGVAHPVAKKFTNGGNSYQFALSPGDLLTLHGDADWEEQCNPQDAEELKKFPSQARVGTIKEHIKNLGGSKLIGRPVMNGAFVISTGVQKLVVTAMGAYRPGDVSWRFPGIVHATEGYMDQCLVRAPAQIFLFSGHGWSLIEHGKAYALFNCYSKDNWAAFNDASFCPYFASYLPGNRWPKYLRAIDENKVVLADKWQKSELRLQWLFVVGCEVLNPGGNPFNKFQSNCGTFGTLMFKELGLKGVLGFSDHGFSSASLMKRYVERASTAGIAPAWLEIFRDKEARAYTWYESNEKYGRSHQKSFADLQKIVPAYLIREGHLNDKLVPDVLEKPVVGTEVQFHDGNSSSAIGVFGE